jgi:hypothetical protein
MEKGVFTLPEAPATTQGIFGWTEIAAQRETYAGNPKTPTWRIGVIERSGHFAIVFEPRTEDFDGFSVLAADDQVQEQVIATFKQIRKFAKGGVTEQRLLWLAFCRVSRVEGDNWLNQVECILKQHSINPSPRGIKDLLALVEQKLADGHSLTCEEILGDLLHEEE